MLDVDPIERQIRQVRRRRNLHELQRGLFVLIATAAVSAAAVVLLALEADTALFAVATWSAVGAVAVTSVLLAREFRRRWLGSGDVAAWIDARARLDGRLATLAALRDGARHAERQFFFPLLVTQNVEQLARWRPEHVVRRRVPRGALVSALTGCAALALALLVAPGLRPHVPEIVYTDEPVDGTEVADDAASTPDRIVVAPSRGEARKRGHDAVGRAGGASTDDAADDSTLARLSSELQDRIRRDLWGREWERVRDAMARADRAAAGRDGRDARGSDAVDDPARGGDDEGGDDSWETSGLPAARRGERRPGAASRRAKDGLAQATDADATARGFGDDADDPTVGHGPSEGAARGAGNATDPNLFGAPSDLAREDGGDTFELGIAAPVRSRQAGPRRGAGEQPPASKDAHPEPARASRAEHAVRKMPVPAAYEGIVREVFAHREDPR